MYGHAYCMAFSFFHLPNLEEVRKLYGKLLHAGNVVPAGHAYLTHLETFMGSFTTNPFVPRHPPRRTADDLTWWLEKLGSSKLSRHIPGPHPVTDRGAFSDASSGVGIGIFICGRWRAWRLIPIQFISKSVNSSISQIRLTQQFLSASQCFCSTLRRVCCASTQCV